MPASLRLEIFPSDLQKSIDFYTNVLLFKLVQLKGTYAYLKRDNIFLGMVEASNDDPLKEKKHYRQPSKGVELVIEVDDLEEERDRIVSTKYKLDDDIRLQAWGLKDFRLTDPDGYYLRITTHSPGKDGQGDGTV